MAHFWCRFDIFPRHFWAPETFRAVSMFRGSSWAKTPFRPKNQPFPRFYVTMVRTGIPQAPLLEFQSDPIMLPEMDIEVSGTSRTSASKKAPITTYGHAFLDMGRTFELVIYNGMGKWPSSSGFTYIPHGGGASIVNYLWDLLLWPHKSLTSTSRRYWFIKGGSYFAL